MSQNQENNLDNLLERIAAATREAEMLLQRIHAMREEALVERTVAHIIATGVQLSTPTEEGNNPHIIITIRHVQAPN
ncbi:hypothetical protein BT96DRAFT_920283 [Gymnopus androsaceus JB14]|uniref:Uncharacterized protein n=1 Tax=Gymnopus androsaceus JB14 TaxID=1447944 RepID=A0A6A4HM95_9AGAR|nr:hypothetical protein BT96DRAFT_920283 [Gymnopus androsaceus JB14]